MTTLTPEDCHYLAGLTEREIPAFVKITKTRGTIPAELKTRAAHLVEYHTALIAKLIDIAEATR